MKISSEHVAKLLGVRLDRVHRARQASPRKAAADADRAVFSSRSEDLRIGLAAARAAGDAEHPRLASLTKQVRSGSYHVPAEAVADAILRDLGRL